MRRTLVGLMASALLGVALPGGPAASRARAVAPLAAPEAVRAPAPVAGQAVPGRVEKPTLDGRRPRFVEGEVLVRFRPGVSRARARGVHASLQARVLERLPAFGLDLVALPPGLTVARALAAYARDPRVAEAEPNLIAEYQGHVPSDPALINDPRFPDQWGLHNTGQPHPVADPPPSTAAGAPGADLDAPEAWATEQGDSDPPVIGVIDSGVAVGHPDLKNQLWTNPGETPGNGMDDDGNGYVDDVNGWNFGGDNADLSDGVPHGTHVASIIGAEGQNGSGVVGVCPHCRIMVLKLGPVPTLAAELEALAYARRMGADIVNGSFGRDIWSRMERNAIKALKKAGILAVFSAGNAALDNDMFLETGSEFSPLFPASYTLANIISVAASNHADRYGFGTGCDLDPTIPRWPCAFTSFGHDSVDVAAPGVDILGAVPSGLAVFNGTSQAAPHVTGVAGLVKSAFPGRSPVQIKNAIMNSADRPDSLRRVWSFALRGGTEAGRFTRTSGRVNAAAALAETDLTAAWAGAGVAVATPRTDGNIDGAKRIRKVRKGRVAYPHDINDVYRKRLKRGTRYRVTLVVPRGKDYDLWLWKPKTKEIWQLEAGCFGPGPCKILGFSAQGKGKDEVVTFKARKSAVHYFQVEAWLEQAGSYTLRVERA